MTLEEREEFLTKVIDALSDPLITMSEGRPHQKAKSRAIDMLGLHFRTMGRHVYLAEEFSVLYPNVPAFTPDVMAVLDVEEPEDDERTAWVVADEGKGVDWVLEVLWSGDRKKDLEENVERYASLGIPEYFVYDLKPQRILGYRLPAGGKRYQPILAQSGLYHSNVLGIDLAIVGRSLKFYQGTIELYDTRYLIERLEGIVANLRERAEQAQREIDKAQREIDKAQREAEQAQRATEQAQRATEQAQRATEQAQRATEQAQRATDKARHDADQARSDANKALEKMRKNVTTLLGARGITCSESNISRLQSCTDADLLDEWFLRALHAKSEADVFGTNT